MVIGYWEQACALLNYGLLHDKDAGNLLLQKASWP
jgi:hypothetical protein